MAGKHERKNERIFSIELSSKNDLKNVSLDGEQNVLIEGSIGTFVRAHFLEDTVLEVIGSKGELRVDLALHDIHPSSERNGTTAGQEVKR